MVAGTKSCSEEATAKANSFFENGGGAEKERRYSEREHEQ